MEKKKIILVSCVLVLVVILLVGLDYYKKQKSGSDNPDTGNVSVGTLRNETVQTGYGDTDVKPGDLIAVNYIGALEDGTMVNSNLSTGTPFEVYIGKGEAPKGWDEALIGMKVGEKRKLTVPSGFDGSGVIVDNAPVDAALIYEVELLEIK